MLSVRNRLYFLAPLLLLLALCLSPLAQTPVRKATYIPFADARPILEVLDEILPAELKGKGADQQAALWPAWVARRDREIRARLAQGDEDSLVNFLMFGTTYTKQPRITSKQIEEIKQQGKQTLVEARAADLAKALAAPGNNERLLFARLLLAERKHLNPATAAGQARVKEYLLGALARVLNENAGYLSALESARLLGNPSEEFAERSRLYRARGLSSDTSILPNFAIEESLKLMQSRGLLAAGSVRRVAIIGPGLDFTDKQSGYDFYPQQTIQPFAVIDTLVRLGLSKADALQVTTFDLSPRVNDHLERARLRAHRGQSYVVQLPRDPQAQWKPETIRYWERFGDRIGDPAPAVSVPQSAGELKIRAVRIRPAVVSRIIPVDTNIVLQRAELPPSERFDLIVATNIFVYYDTLDQSLAMANIERMMRPGGVMLSNNALLELPFSRVHSIGYETVVYSDRPDDGDHIVWYQRAPD
ncbi:MAG TPA: class I SAM-dependent methyltransferase [Pyrinomonadaceae bacterium]|jgi:hypothetical protein|nr:class I SAM-dependent methyltransferase [Pyrinomonadaceae bacterium]